MNIFLDTNIISQDFTLQSKRFAAFFDYLAKTNSTVLFPQVVIQEIEAVYRRRLSGGIANIDKAYGNLNKDLLTALSVPNRRFNIDQRVSRYMEMLRSKFHIRKYNTLKHKNIELDSVLDRLINHQKPFTENREEFRDTVIWLALLEHAKRKKYDSLAIISQNYKDFESPDKSGLHPDLVKEANYQDLGVEYYRSIEDFLKSHAAFLEFVNEKWLAENVDVYSLEFDLCSYLKEHTDDIKQTLELYGRLPRDIDDIDVDLKEMEDYYVLEQKDGRYQLWVDIDFFTYVQFTTLSDRPDEFSSEVGVTLVGDIIDKKIDKLEIDNVWSEMIAT